jgi:hypothetical protein
MQDLLSQFFGQDQRRQQEYQDFTQRYAQDPRQLDPKEAARRYREMAEMLDPQDMDEANEQAFGQLPEQERRELAERFRQVTQDPNRPYQGYPQEYDLNRASQPRELGRMASRASREDPDLLEQLVGENSPLASTGAKLALAGAAAFLASRFLGGRR